MKWFKELRKGQKILFLTNVVLILVLSVLMFSGVGNAELFVMGVFIGVINLFSIIFARKGFKFGIYLNADNVGDDVEPSELKYWDWYSRWGFSTLAVLACVICGLVFN